MSTTSTLPDTDARIERLARKRAGAKMGWYIHATVYVAINLMLIMLAASSGRDWAVFPALGSWWPGATPGLPT